MSWLDWGTLALAVAFTVQGLFKGAVPAAFGTLAVVLSYLASGAVLPAVGARMAQGTPLPLDWARTIGFVVIFLVAYGVMVLAFSVLGGARRPGMQAQILGAPLGLVKGLAVAMAAVGILLASPLGGHVGQDVERSAIARYVAQAQRATIAYLRRLSPIPFEPVGPDHRF